MTESNVNWGTKAQMAICRYVGQAYPRRSYSSRTYYLAFDDKTVLRLWCGPWRALGAPEFEVEIPCTEAGVKAAPGLIEKARARAEQEAGMQCVKVEGQRVESSTVEGTGRPQTAVASRGSMSGSGTRRARTAKAARRRAGSSLAAAEPGTSATGSRRPAGRRPASITVTRSRKKANGAKPKKRKAKKTR